MYKILKNYFYNVKRGHLSILENIFNLQENLLVKFI
jgi:hypothetical protein